MGNTDRPFGFQPYGPILRQNLYCVITAPTINIYHNDVVVAGGVNTNTPHGYMMAIEDGAVPDGNPGILGSVTSIFDEKMDPVKYIAATEAGNSVIAGYVMVADSPNQLFIAQEDAVTNAIDLDEGSMNANIISATLCAGNSSTGISTQEIDSDTAATTAALQVKMLRPHEADTPGDDADIGCRYICQLNEHYFGDSIAGL
jgi:hypothetical protein